MITFIFEIFDLIGSLFFYLNVYHSTFLQKNILSISHLVPEITIPKVGHVCHTNPKKKNKIFEAFCITSFLDFQ